MIFKVCVNGVFPSLNEYIAGNRQRRGNWVKANDMKHRDENIIINSIKKGRRYSGLKTTTTFNSPVVIHYRYYEPSRRRDLDNISGYFHKVFQDACVREGILQGDSWKYVVGFSDTFLFDKKHPRIEVEIEEQNE